jgi:arylsulfatase A-like enzyme
MRKSNNPSGESDRRTLLKGMAAAILGLAIGGTTLMPAAARAAEQRRPNIIFMFADDQAYESMGYTGNTVIQTPNMDRLARDGVFFEKAFVTTPICAVSRASILTGQHMRRHGIQDFATPLSDEALDQSYPVLLREAGYRTAFLGKLAIGGGQFPERSLPAHRFDLWYGFPQNISFKQEVDGEERYLTDEMTTRAVEFMKSTPKDQPFCITLAYKEPHGPLNYLDPDFPNYYEDVHIPAPETMTREAYEHGDYLLLGPRQLPGCPRTQREVVTLRGVHTRSPDRVGRAVAGEPAGRAPRCHGPQYRLGPHHA